MSNSSEEDNVASIDIEQGNKTVEDMGYDVPFVSYTWEHWQEMQIRVLLSFARFQRAIERRQPQLALSIALEIQEVRITMQKEVGQWIGESQQ